MREKSVLQEADALINGDRRKSYGRPAEDFARTAGIANSLGFRIIGHDGELRKLENYDVPLFMVAVKLSRLKAHPENWHRDSVTDGAGYFGTMESTHDDNHKS